MKFPNELDDAAAALTAERTTLHRIPTENDSAFVKRIVTTYMNAEVETKATAARQAPREPIKINF